MVEFSLLQLHLDCGDSALHRCLLDSSNGMGDHLSNLSSHVQPVNQPAGQGLGYSVVDPGSNLGPACSRLFKSHFHLHAHLGERARDSFSSPELVHFPFYQFPFPFEFTAHDLANIMTDHCQTIGAWKFDDPRFTYEPSPFRVIIAPVREMEHVFSGYFHGLGCLDMTQKQIFLTVPPLSHISTVGVITDSLGFCLHG